MTLTDGSRCHHCHIHAPIPLNALIRTHPLRSQSQCPAGRSFPHVEQQQTSFSVPAPATSTLSRVSQTLRHVSRGGSRGGGGTLRSDKSLRTHSLPRVGPVLSPRSAPPRLGRVDSAPVHRGIIAERTSTTAVEERSRKEDIKTLRSIAGSEKDIVVSKKKTKKKFGAHAVLLICAYSLLLVLAVVIGVVVAQQQIDRRSRGRRQRLQGPLPAPVAVQGAALAPARRGRVRRPVAPAPAPPPIRVRPGSARFAPQAEAPVSVRGPPPPPIPAPRRPAPIPPPAPVPTTDILDFDYIDYDVVQEDKATTLDRSPLFESPLRVAPEPVRPQPPRAAPRAPAPAPRAPAPAPRAPAPPPPPPRSAPAPEPVRSPPRASRPRDTAPLSNIEIEFNLDPNREAIRGLREPEVQIVKSWSHSNPDGTFSWGYIDTEGTFKNETRGLDCVVRGIYGYYDDNTGEPLQFTYESGNPCDPNEPKAFYDYDLLGFPVTEETDRPSRRDRQG